MAAPFAFAPMPAMPAQQDPAKQGLDFLTALRNFRGFNGVTPNANGAGAQPTLPGANPGTAPGGLGLLSGLFNGMQKQPAPYGIDPNSGLPITQDVAMGAGSPMGFTNMVSSF